MLLELEESFIGLGEDISGLGIGYDWNENELENVYEVGVRVDFDDDTEEEWARGVESNWVVNGVVEVGAFCFLFVVYSCGV